MQAKGLIFDFDGTLAELSLDFNAMRLAVEELAVASGWSGPFPSGYLLEEVAAMQATLDHGFGEKAHALIQEIEVEAARNGRLFPFTTELLSLARGRGLALAVISRNCGPAIRTALPAIDELVDAFLPREAVTEHKPHPGQVLAACRALALLPASAMMIGDHPTDMQAAAAAGCRAVGVTSGRSSAEELREAGAELVLQDASQLLDQLL